MRHQDLEQPAAIHIPWFVSATDPALDPDNEVTAYKAWWDLTSQRIKIRNTGNTEWRLLGEGGIT